MRLDGLVASGALLGVEAAACACVLDGGSATGALVHASAAALAFVLTRRQVRDAALAAGAARLGALLTLALPGAGAALLAVVAWPSWRRGRAAAAAGVVEVALPGVAGPLRSREARSASRSIHQVLRDACSPEERVRAVMALRHMDARRAVPLLRQAFGHRSEDVRLLAFGILEQREKLLRTRIKRAEAELAAAIAAARAPAALARCHRRLARDHWELVYAGFVSGDLEPVVLEKVREQAERALELEPNASMQLLLARLHLRQRAPERAWSCLLGADALGAAPAATTPLLAEAAFQLRRFSEIPSILGRVPRPALQRPELAPVASFWMDRAGGP